MFVVPSRIQRVNNNKQIFIHISLIYKGFPFPLIKFAPTIFSFLVRPLVRPIEFLKLCNMDISTNFFLNKNKRYANAKKLAISGRVTYWVTTEEGKQKRQFKFPTGHTCDVTKFIRGQAKSTAENATLINANLTKFKDKADELYTEYLRKDKFPAPAIFKAKLLSDVTTVEEDRNFVTDFKGFIEDKRESLADKGLQNLIQTLTHIENFSKRKKYTLDYSTINAQFFLKFKTYCMFDEDKDRPVDKHAYYKVKLHPNTFVKYIRSLKRFLNYADANNWTNYRNYKGFKVKEEPSVIVSLTDSELESIASLDVEGKKPLFKLTRDYFLLACETGSRFSDYESISPKNFHNVKDGIDLHMKHKKTGNEVVIPVSKRVLNVFKKYQFNLPEPPSNKVMNDYLKHIASLAGIDKNITTHTGRKTFCTSLYRLKVPVAYIRKLSGHDSEKNFYRYIGVDKGENAELVRSSLEDRYKIESKDFLSISKAI